MITPYHEYAKGYPNAIASIATCLAGSHLAKLEAIALRFAHALEENTLDLKQGNEREFLCDILVQATNEMFAMIGCLRNGALLPSYHHMRSVLELYASLEHVYCAPAKRERKLEKFVEYPNVSKYLHSHSWQQQLSKGEITNDQFIQGCAISQNEFNDLKKRLTEWQRIWNGQASSDFRLSAGAVGARARDSRGSIGRFHGISASERRRQFLGV